MGEEGLKEEVSALTCEVQRLSVELECIKKTLHEHIIAQGKQ